MAEYSIDLDRAIDTALQNRPELAQSEFQMQQNEISFNLNNNSTIDLNFSLDDDSDPTLPNSQTFSVPPGMWTASESMPPPTGWSLTGLVCVDPSSNTTVNLSTGIANNQPGIQ
jgi:hypothetical protein